MTKRRITSAVLALVMAMSSTYSLALAQESEAVYTYRNENGETITITQEQLDAEHWNVDALGDTLPIIYEKFPMSVDTFVNDLAEVSLDIEYMKKIEDMDSVTLRITDVATGTDIYNDEITNYSFYSPNLEPGKQYEMHLIEVLNGETTDYGKAVSINKVSSRINEVADFSNAEDDTKILVGDTDVLRAGMSIDEDGKLVINTAVAQYERVAVGDFYDYIDTMPQNKTYRLYMIDGDEQYEGFISTTNRREIYTYEASVIDLVAPCANSSLVTELENLSYSELANVETLDITDASFVISNVPIAEAAYRAYEISIPTEVLENVHTNNAVAALNITVSGDSRIRVRAWRNENGNVSTLDQQYGSNTVSLIYGPGNFAYSGEGSYVYLTFMIYFPDTISGTGMINYEFLMGYNDPGFSSVYKAYTQTTAPTSLSNTEYTLTDGWDVDAFRIETTEENRVYKVELKNRSLADQTKLESGIYAEGGLEKRVIGWSVGLRQSSVVWSECVVYTVAKNTDLVFYKEGDSDPNVITVRHKPNFGGTDPDYYQLSYQLMPIASE